MRYPRRPAGERSVVHGAMNKAQVAASKILGGGVSAEMHRREAEAGTAEKQDQ